MATTFCGKRPFLSCLLVNNVFSNVSGLLERSFTSSSVLGSRIKRRHTHKPFWLPKKTNKVPNEPLSTQNIEFLDSVKRLTFQSDVNSSPLKSEFAPWSSNQTWSVGTRRVGILARKIGVVPLWTQDGNKIMSTMLHVEDTHVVKHIKKETYQKSYVGEKIMRPSIYKEGKTIENDILVVGALSGDPSKFTKSYNNLFTSSGLTPKKKLTRFFVSDNALIQPGTPLYASHFMVGQNVNILGKGIQRGFQGVMKRWGFRGMPSDFHGCTKSHRRPGHIGSGKLKGRVWPGQKLPGNMGGNISLTRCIPILRINHKEGVIFVKGQAVPGKTGDFVSICDTNSKEKGFKSAPRFFPTSTTDDNLSLPEDEYAEGIHRFGDSTIIFK